MSHPDKRIRYPDNGWSTYGHGDYGVEHSGVVYAFGPGQHTIVYTGGTTPEEYAADFTRLLDGTRQGSGS